MIPKLTRINGRYKKESILNQFAKSDFTFLLESANLDVNRIVDYNQLEEGHVYFGCIEGSYFFTERVFNDNSVTIRKFLLGSVPPNEVPPSKRAGLVSYPGNKYVHLCATTEYDEEEDSTIEPSESCNNCNSTNFYWVAMAMKCSNCDSIVLGGT